MHSKWHITLGNKMCTHWGHCCEDSVSPFRPIQNGENVNLLNRNHIPPNGHNGAPANEKTHARLALILMLPIQNKSLNGWLFLCVYFSLFHSLNSTVLWTMRMRWKFLHILKPQNTQSNALLFVWYFQCPVPFGNHHRTLHLVALRAYKLFVSKMAKG